MRRVLVAELEPGMVVARDVADGKGGLLLRRGVNLSHPYIRALEDRGFAWVYISDEESDLLPVEDYVTAYISNTCPALLRGLRALEAIGDERGADEETADASLDQDVEEVACILSQVLAANVMTALARMAAHDHMLLAHGLATAAVAVSFGMRLGFDEAGLCSLATGCLLHDCGKTLLGEHLFLLPVLTEEQLGELRRHPLLGLQMARELGLDDQQALAIIGQHHERQDGLGYPRNLRGTNRVINQHQSGRISLGAEIAAIADSYSMLVSTTLRDASVDELHLAEILRRESGAVLCRQLVDHFLNGRRAVPVGAPVHVRSGRLAGCRGMVVRRSPTDYESVVVRLVQAASGGWMQPVELDLGEEPETQIAVVLP